MVLGVDIGGSEIKAAPVDVVSGQLGSIPARVPTPDPPSPEGISEVVVQLVEHFAWSGPIGCTFPGPIVGSIVRDAGYLAEAWSGLDAEALLASAAGSEVSLLNDADAAGIAEMRFGDQVHTGGTVLILTFGTGIGSALFIDGRLVPNTEFGTLLLEQGIAEEYASARVRSTEGLGDHEWAGRVSTFINHVGSLIYPKWVVLGGGISNRWDDFARELKADFAVLPATFAGDAGIVGAALFAADREQAQPDGSVRQVS